MFYPIFRKIRLKQFRHTGNEVIREREKNYFYGEIMKEKDEKKIRKKKEEMKRRKKSY